MFPVNYYTLLCVVQTAILFGVIYKVRDYLAHTEFFMRALEHKMGKRLREVREEMDSELSHLRMNMKHIDSRGYQNTQAIKDNDLQWDKRFVALEEKMSGKCEAKKKPKEKLSSEHRDEDKA